MVTGRPQAVMVHVIVGAANATGGLINAARAGVPMLFTAGRNPITEAGFRGSRNRPIHWAQESFDQGALVREFVKWDYELRNFSQLETVVDRALAITAAEPQGPVYLTLPREVLGEAHEIFEYTDNSRAPRPVVVGRARGIEDAARILAAARRPLVITKAAGRDPAAVPALVAVAEALGAPVVDQFHTYVNFPQDHALHGGFDSSPYLDDADAILVVESDVPWFPDLKAARPEAKLVHVGVDPLFTRYPVRGFAADVALPGAPRLTLAALATALRAGIPPKVAAERRERVAAADASAARPLTHGRGRWQRSAHRHGVALPRIADVLDRARSSSTNTTSMPRRPLHDAGTYFAAPSSAASAGDSAPPSAPSSRPRPHGDLLVGDGAYIFGAPTAAHWVSRAYEAPVLWVIFNNLVWNAVKRSVLSHAPDGLANRTGMPLTELDPPPDYELICQPRAATPKSRGSHEAPRRPRPRLDIVRRERRRLLNVSARTLERRHP